MTAARVASAGIALAALVALAGCAGQNALQRARPLGYGVLEVALEGSGAVRRDREQPAGPPAPLEPFTPRVLWLANAGFDLCGRGGLSERTDGFARIGTGGAEVGTKYTFQDGSAPVPWAFAGMWSVRARRWRRDGQPELRPELAGGLLLERSLTTAQVLVLAPRAVLVGPQLQGLRRDGPLLRLAPSLTLTSLTRLTPWLSLGAELTVRHPGFPVEEGLGHWPWLLGSVAVLVNPTPRWLEP